MRPISGGEAIRASMQLGIVLFAVGACGPSYDPGPASTPSGGSGGASSSRSGGGSGQGSGGGSTSSPICSSGSGPKICIDQSSFTAGSPIAVRFSGGPARPKDWIAVYPSGRCNPSCPSGSTLWQYCGTNTQTAASTGKSSGTVTIDSSANASSWPLSNGTWELLYLVDDGYDPIARLTFQVTGGSAAPKCSPGTGECKNCKCGQSCFATAVCSSCTPRCGYSCTTDQDCRNLQSQLNLTVNYTRCVKTSPNFDIYKCEL